MEDVVQNIARHQIDARGQRARIITLDRVFRKRDDRLARNGLVDGISVVRLPFFGSERYPLCPAVIRHIQSADVVHVHGIDFFFDFLALTKSVHGKPLIASTHGGFFHTRFASRLKQLYFRTITRTSAKSYNKVVATSENDGTRFGRIIGPEKLKVIENGVNIEKYSDKSSGILTPTLIYFGRWSVNKGILDTIEFFKLLAVRNPAWRLILAGREYDYTANDLAAAVRRAGLEHRVIVVPNPTEQELAALIEQSSYFICLSKHEGFGIAPIEAMSAGLVPVLSDIPPFRRLVEQSRLGMIVAKVGIGKAAAELESMHSAGHAKHLDRKTGVKRFAEQYGWRDAASRYADMYCELAEL